MNIDEKISRLEARLKKLREWKKELEKIRDGQVFILISDHCDACKKLLNEKFIREEIEKGNIIVLKGGPIKEMIEEKLNIRTYPFTAVYYEDIGFVDEDTAIELEIKWQEESSQQKE